MNNKIIILLLAGIAALPAVKAQDPVFSQPYLSPIYLNPAATGAGDYDLRISAMYRRQWWSIPSAITYTALSVDKYIPSKKTALGLLATHSSEGYLKRTGVYGSLAYTICSKVDASENIDESTWFVSGGIQVGIAQTRVDYSKLVFDDQIDAGGVIPGSVTSADKVVNNDRWYGDIGAGFLYSQYLNDYNRVLIGVSAHHMNRPDESLIQTANSYRSEIPVRWTVNALFTRLIPKSDWSWSFGGIFYKQQAHNAVQIGAEVMQHKYDMGLGIWYRGSVNFKDTDAFTVTFSINLFGGKGDGNHKVKAGVAHDAPVGNNRYSYTTGSSELGLVWDIKTYEQAAGLCKPKINCKCDCPAD